MRVRASRAPSSSRRADPRFAQKRAELPRKAAQNPTFVAFHARNHQFWSAFSEGIKGRADRSQRGGEERRRTAHVAVSASIFWDLTSAHQSAIHVGGVRDHCLNHISAGPNLACLALFITRQNSRFERSRCSRTEFRPM